MQATAPTEVVLHMVYHEAISPYPVDGSTIIYVICNDGTATAFYLGDGRFMTARHVVASPKTQWCDIDGRHVQVLSKGADAAHDWAIVSAPWAKMAYKVSYTCNRMHPGDTYLSTGYAEGHTWQVTTVLRASQQVDSDDGTREVRGSIIEGMSGGPVADLQGVVYGINSWQMQDNGRAVPLSGVLELAQTPLCRKTK